jgi:hypothetical protein
VTSLATPLKKKKEERFDAQMNVQYITAVLFDVQVVIFFHPEYIRKE